MIWIHNDICMKNYIKNILWTLKYLVTIWTLLLNKIQFGCIRSNANNFVKYIFLQQQIHTHTFLQEILKMGCNIIMSLVWLIVLIFIGYRMVTTKNTTHILFFETLLSSFFHPLGCICSVLYVVFSPFCAFLDCCNQMTDLCRKLTKCK